MVNYHPDKQTNQLNLKRLQISFAYFINYMMCKTLENKRKKNKVIQHHRTFLQNLYIHFNVLKADKEFRKY